MAVNITEEQRKNFQNNYNQIMKDEGDTFTTDSGTQLSADLLDDNVAESLIRAERERMKKTGGPPSILNEATLRKRSGDIQSAIETAYGQPSLLKQYTGIPSVSDLAFDATEKMGISVTADIFTKFILNQGLAIADLALRPFGKQQDPTDVKKYSDYYDNLVKNEDTNFLWAGMKTGWKMYSDTPELKNTSLVVKETLQTAANNPDLLSDREVEELIKYNRPNATVTEQFMRAVPEVAGFTKAGAMWTFRNRKKIVKQVDDKLVELFGKKKPDISAVKASDDEISQAVMKLAGERSFSVLKKIRLGNIAGIGYTSRLYRNAKYKKWLEDKNLTIAANRKVDYFKKRVAVAKRRKDNPLLKREQLALNLAKQQRMSTIPKELITIPLTETGAAIGATIGERYFSDEWGALFGALGGGFGSLALFEGALKLGKRGIQAATGVFADVGQSLGKIDNETIERLAITGKIPKNALTGLTKQEQKSVQDFAFFIRALPEQQRGQVYNQLKYLREIKNDLEKAGIDKDLLELTVDKATGLIPLMMMREVLTSSTQSLSRGFKGEQLDTTLVQTLENENVIKEQLKQFRGLMDNLSNSAGDAGVQNEKFDSFVKAMRKFTETESAAINESERVINDDLSAIMSMITDPSVLHSVDDRAKISEIVTGMLKRDFLTRQGAEETGKRLRELDVPQFGEQADEMLDKIGKGDIRAEGDLVDLVGKYFNPNGYQTNAENSARLFAQSAQDKHDMFTRTGSKKFEALDDNLDLDITDWLISLYSKDSTEVYSAIINTKYASKLKERLGGTRVPNADLARIFSNYSAETNAKEVIGNSPIFRENLYQEIKELDPESLIINRATGDTLESSDGLTYDIVKNFFAKNAAKDQDVTDFDVFLMLREFSQETDAQDLLKITVKPRDIQQLSSSFSRQSASSYESNKPLSRKLGEMAETLVSGFKYENTVAEGAVRDQIKDAKDYWLNNVVKRYRNPEFNPIGYQLTRKIGGEPIKDPVEWLDPEKLFNGTSQDAINAIENIKRTFGEYDSATNTYILPEGDTKETVRSLINDLFARHLSDQPSMQRGKALTEQIGKTKGGEKPVGTLGDAVAAEGTRVLREKFTPDILASGSIAKLKDEGYITPEAVSDYNRSVTKYIGSDKDFNDVLKRNLKDIKNASARLTGAFKERNKALQTAIEFTGLGGASRKVDDYQQLLDFFVLNPQGSSRSRDVASELSKSLKISAGEAKDLFSDIIIESLSRSSYSKLVDVEPGKSLKTFDHEKLYEIVVTNEKVLQEIIGKKYDSIKRMAEFLRIQNRDVAQGLTESNIKYTVPKGLSVESLLSRAYSISRGVISPKYVATEVALLSFRKKNAEALSKVLQDPKITDAVIDVIDGGGTEIRKYNSDIFTTLINGLAYEEQRRKKQERDKQMQALERREYR